MELIDYQIRLAAFEWLKEQKQLHGELLPRRLLESGFEFQGQRITLISPQGIFKPRQLKLPLTITTAPNSSYDDTMSTQGLLLYKYRGTDPDHRDNAGLREAMRQHVPLIYFLGIIQGKYEAVYPVFIVGDDPTNLTFKVVADDFESMQYQIGSESRVVSDIENDIRRKYVTTQVRQRIHQHIFRERVLDAYGNQCSFCRLRHPELLDAAHIIGDKEPEGEPVVSNGLSLCKIHHAAFDEMLLGVRPADYTIEVREDIRNEEDGPMLVHGLQKLHGTEIILPRIIRDRPDQNLLDIKFRRFKQAI